MSAYIPLIRTTKWIDLSSEHKKLRKELEEDTRKACVEKGQLQPIMLQGAFGIGKTNSLFYLFHYGWCSLKTPTFFVSLDELTQRIKEYAATQQSGKIQNAELGTFINGILKEQIKFLKEGNWEEAPGLYFPEFKAGDLNKYLQGFTKAEIIEDFSREIEYLPSEFSEKVIREAVGSTNRPILLIDEFESKFYELKKHVETSGGGVLRELFDQIVQDLDLFYLVICNGPASGYEIAKERGDDITDSETAANRRLKTKPIPFPTANLLQRSFLKNEPKGYINFIWWLSRCRPGHIIKLRDALGSLDELKDLDTNELINKKVFNEPIENGGEAVTYLKTSFFNEVSGRVFAAFLGKMLSSFSPASVNINHHKNDLKECVPYFYCSSGKINVNNDLLPQLWNDLYVNHLKKYEEDGKYLSVNYIQHLQPYFSYILNGISDEQGDIAFGMINDSKPDEIIADIFLTPLFELTYDFISQYEDDSVKETRETLDFLLNMINLITASKEKGELETLMAHTCDKFEKCKLLKRDEVYLQLSLYAIRESIEQPIGSPKLKYKNEQIDALLPLLSTEKQLPIICQKERNLHLYFIPDLGQDQLANYLNTLKAYLLEGFNKFHKNGETIARIIYIKEADLIEDFKRNLLFQEGDKDHPHAIHNLKKIDVINQEAYQLNFSSQIGDFIDSVSKIGLVGVKKGELNNAWSGESDQTLELKQIIKEIADRPWTDKKETIRTIEHYRKLLFDGQNSVFSLIERQSWLEYDGMLAEAVCDKSEFLENISEYGYLEKIINDDAASYSSSTISLALLYLIENNEINTALESLLRFAKEDFKMDKFSSAGMTEPAIDYKNLLQVLTKNKEALDYHKNSFDLNSSFISRLSKLVKTLNIEDNFDDLSSYLGHILSNFDYHFIGTYHAALGTSLRPELTKALYNLKAAESINFEDLKLAITNAVKEQKERLASLRYEITEEVSELREMLDEEKDFNNYTKSLSKVGEMLNLIERILKDKESYSSYAIIHFILERLKIVLKSSKKFLAQLKQINNSVISYNQKVKFYQGQVDEFYRDPLTSKLIDFIYPTKRHKDYFWKTEFIRYGLRSDEHYSSLLAALDAKSSLNPFSNPVIYDATINTFQKSLKEVMDKKEIKFKEVIAKMTEAANQAKITKKIGAFTEQLLNITAE